jgi:putative tricarboxylic transport membrane protein
MFKLASERGTIAKADFSIGGDMFSGLKSVSKHWKHTLKSTIIGGVIGMIPGSGASVSNFIAYAEAMRSSKDHSFGKGDIRGVISAEAANNATVSGSLVPTLSFGIPGSGSTAVLLGGLLLHGLRPGPNLFSDNITIVYVVFLSLILTAVLLLILGLTVVIRFGYITRVDTDYIIPLVIVLATVGSFALRVNWVDVATILILGILGLLMKRYDYSIVAFILGVVLGGIAEQNLYRSLQISGGSLDIFYTRPLSLLLLILISVILLTPLRGYFSDSATPDG